MNSGVSMIDTLRDFVAKVNEIGVEYMVTGSFAMSAYGEIRMTRDIDIVMQILPSQADGFTHLFQSDYYVNIESVRSAIARRSLFNIVSHAHGGKLDCIIMKDTEFARSSFARRFKATVSGVEFWTTTKEDLIIAKLNWARDTFSEMQIRDVANLTASEYDVGYVANWVGRLDLIDIWSEVETWKTQRRKRGT